jgi:phosphohistidine phosphatase
VQFRERRAAHQVVKSPRQANATVYQKQKMIYLVHHGDAVGPEVDPMRPLSERGRGALLLLADEAARRGVKPEVIWHSGKLRAKQTAEAFWKVCNPFASLTAERGMQPGDPPQWIHDRLVGETRDLMLVGHMPHLPRLLRALVGAPEDAVEPGFPQHGLVALEPGRDGWKISFAIGGP